MASTSQGLFPSICHNENLMKPSPHAQSLEQTRIRSKENQSLPRAVTVPSLEKQLVEWTIVYAENELEAVTKKEKKNKAIRNGIVDAKHPADNFAPRQAINDDSKYIINDNLSSWKKDLYKSETKLHAVEDVDLYKPFERQTRVCNWVRENNESLDINSLQKALPRDHPKQLGDARAYCESTQQENVRKLREKIDLKIRQEKLASKLNFDHTDFQRLLAEANHVINTLEAKLERREIYLQNRAKKEIELVDMTDDLRKERDKKLGEYRALMRNVNEVLADKEADIDSWEKKKLDAEGSYTRELQKEYQLNKKIEARDRQIETLRIKLMKAKKWKEEARQ